jgi:hypothetical protein
LLKEVLRIAPLLDRSGCSCCNGGGGVPGNEVHGAVALFAHICMIRGNTDLAMRLHMEALELKSKLVHTSGQPMEPCCSNLAVVWLQNSSEASQNDIALLHRKPSSELKSFWTDPNLARSGSDPLYAMMFSLPDNCAPEVLAKWVVHSDILEAKGYAKRRIYEPENAAAAAWLAAVEKEQEEPLEPVAANVMEFFIDRAVQRGQLVLPSDSNAESRPEVSLHDAPLPPQSASAAESGGHACHPHAEGTAPSSLYQDCLSTDNGEFINLYANMHEQAPANSAGVDGLPIAPVLPQNDPAPAVQQLPDEVE